MKVVTVFVFAFALFLLTALLALAEAPTTVGYQGRLTDASGTPITETLSITFKLYATLEGGTAPWSETQSVEIKDGHFNVLLGELNDLPVDVLKENSYLAIQVGNDNEMSPRQYLSAVPYARTLAPGNIFTYTVTLVSPAAPLTRTLTLTGTVDGPVFSATNVAGSAMSGRTVATITLPIDSPNWKAIAGVLGESENDNTSGILGTSRYGYPVLGLNDTAQNINAAVTGWSTGGGDGVRGYSQLHYGVYAGSILTYSLYVDGTSYFAQAVTFNQGFNDVAEMFDAPSQSLSAGDVAVLDPDGGLAVKLAERAYDTAVAGVVSSKPAIVLPATADMSDGIPLALTGRVLCKVDAQYGSIEVGDLLTTSPTPGHAMRVTDRAQATGAIIGKALEPWGSGTGTILILVTLQ